jgi:hypothetical protein
MQTILINIDKMNSGQVFLLLIGGGIGLYLVLSLISCILNMKYTKGKETDD